VLISKVHTFVAQDTLHLGQGPVSCAHDLVQRNVTRLQQLCGEPRPPPVPRWM
jgi:hypothetical protein